MQGIDTATQGSNPADPGVLLQRWQDLRRDTPGMRIRDAARELAVSEAELLATGCGANVTRLAGDWREVLRQVPSLGRVLALTRNEHCVHERRGTYSAPSFDGHVGLVLGDDIDLRLFMSNWAAGFAVSEETSVGERRSLQFFDGTGAAVHKIYLLEGSDAAAYERVVAAYAAADQSPLQSVQPAPAREEDRPDGEIDVAALRDGWAALKDTHEFFPLLRRCKVGREQALRLGGTDFAIPLPLDAARRALELAAADVLPIMIFVGNRGIIQIHTGPVRRLRATGPWFNVLDPNFNLHLRETAITSMWLVRKPTADGDVTSLELFDAAGDQIALMFGKRKPGSPEDLGWRALAHSMAGSLTPAWT